MKKNVAPDTTEATETPLEAALELAHAGFAVFPLWGVRDDLSCACGNPKRGQIGKHPRCTHGHNDATIDECQIRRWWSEPERGAADAWQCDPDSNIGIAVPEGMVIVDVDPRNEGLETFEKMCDEHGWEWAQSLTANSGSGGFHVYLSCDPGRRFPKNLDDHFGRGVDLKQCGGYVVAPPSKHKSGRAYSWDQSVAETAPAPAWLTLLSKVKSAEDVAPAPNVPDGAELDEPTRAKLDQAIEEIEPFYLEGTKHHLALAIGGYFRNAQLPALAAKYVVSQLPSTDPSARVKDSIWAWQSDVKRPSGADALRGLGMHDLLAKLDALKLDAWSRLREKQAANRAKREAENGSKPPANSADPLRDAGTPAADTADFPGPYILQSATHAETILLWRGADRGHQPVAPGSLRLVIKDAGLEGQIPLYAKEETLSGKTKTVKLAAPALVERHGKHFDHTVYDFAKRVSEYKPERATVVVGYPDACTTAGVFDSGVDAWLRALAGDAYERLAVWIASCAQANINRLSAALVLIGPKDSGKSLFSCATAGLWGAATPPAAALLVSRFNGELRKCAVVCDEEAQLFGTKALSTKRFRDVTQSTERSIELKGQETFTLRGALRIIVPCNEVSDLRFTDLGGPDIVAAVSDRLLVIDCKPRAAECREALAGLRPQGAWTCDRDRVIGHMAWLCETVELPAERFLGAGGAGAGSVLAGHVEDHAELWETFRDWLDGAGEAKTWRVHAGRLCANPAELAVSLEAVGRGWDLNRVRGGLAAFKVDDYQPKIVVGDAVTRPRMWELDSGAIVTALGLDAEACDALALRLEQSKPRPQVRVDGVFAK